MPTSRREFRTQKQQRLPGPMRQRLRHRNGKSEMLPFKFTPAGGRGRLQSCPPQLILESVKKLEKLFQRVEKLFSTR